MPNNEGVGFVDYVLWGADGKPLGLVEAKRTRKDARVGQQQAKLYADCLEARFGQRPVIFYSNGYEHWIWDDIFYPPRQIGGFLKRDELELIDPAPDRPERNWRAEAINRRIVERPYQHRAIRNVARSFEQDGERKALLVMATGSGKTRTVIALVDLLMRAGWVKRVLFLADRCSAGESGSRRVQGPSAGRGTRQSRHRAHQRRPGFPLDLIVRAEVLRLADIFRCRVVDVSPNTYSLEITGNHAKIGAVLDNLKVHGILDIVRTGTLAIQRSNKKE